MTCLSHEQLVALALQQNVDADGTAHVESCASCQSKLESVHTVLMQLDKLHKKSAEQHQASRASLLEQIAREEPEPETAIFRRATRWIGELTMRQRLALLTASLTPVLGFVVLWITLSSTPAIAMEEMAKKIREAKSYQLMMVQEMTFTPKPGAEPVTQALKQKSYWQAPGSFRWDMQSAEKIRGHWDTKIFFTDKPGIELTNATKTYQLVPAYQGKVSPIMILHRLGTYEGEADKQLGKRKIEDRDAIGFELNVKKIDPDAGAGTIQIWLNPESQLPILVNLAMDLGGINASIRFEKIRWNVDLDPKLFDVTPPTGYKDTTRPTPKISEQVEHIVSALKTYDELVGGHYPRVKMVYGDVTRDELLKKLGIEGIPTREQMMSEKYVAVLTATRGFATINVIQRENPDAVWNGLTVTSKDADKILFRWKRDDGTYQVIYGDLKSENVTAEKLQQLEAK